MARIALAVLDMAGTTVKDDGQVLACFLEAARIVRLPVDPLEVNAQMGMRKYDVFLSLSRIAKVGDPEKTAALAYDAFREILEGTYREMGASPLPGVAEAIRALRDRGVKVALNTGFYREVTDLLIDLLGWRDRVDAVVCGDDVPEGRPAPYMIHEAMKRTGVRSVHEILVAGDTPSDVIAGHNSGARVVVAVTSGAHKADRLRREKPTYLLEGVRELPDLVSRIERLTAA
jgi:phosphoglycolate phosphatase